MRIADVRVTIVGGPWRDLVFVELHADNGLVGLGEVRPINKTETLVACLRELAPRRVIGRDPFNLEALAWDIRRGDYGRPGEVVQSALAAFDIACWDLIGQALEVPVYRLLGGAFRERVPAYANGWYRSERDPDIVADLARAVVARGYRALKIDPFGSAFGHLTPRERRLSLAIVGAVRDAVGPDIDLMIEMHGRFTADEAARLARDLEPHRPAWIEEPVPPESPGPLRRVRAATSLPIASGERIHTLEEFRDYLEEGVVDVVQADLTHFGGFGPMKHLAALAEASYLSMAPHNVCGPVGTMANIHLAVSTPAVTYVEHFNDFADPWVQSLVDFPPKVDPDDGCFGIPPGTGLGLRLDHAAAAEHPGKGADIRLFEPGWERRA